VFNPFDVRNHTEILYYVNMVFRNFLVTLQQGIAAFVIISLSPFGLAAQPTINPLPQARVPSAEQREALAQKSVEEKLKFWQKRLNLERWEIRVQLVRNTSLKPKTLGNIHWDTGTMQATIDVQSSYDYKLPFQEMLDDMEFTVVHELVHLQLSSLPRSEASRSAEEHAVNEITQALLNLAKR
jgi:hypothetical protein